MGSNEMLRPFGGAFHAVVIVVAGGLISWEVATRSQSLESAAVLCSLGAAIAVLVSAVFFYLHWHVQLDDAVARLIIVATAFAVQQLNWCLLLVDSPSRTLARSASIGAFQVVVTVALGLVLVADDGPWAGRDPLGFGMALGIGVVLLRGAILAASPPRSAVVVYAVALTVIGGVIAWRAGRVVDVRGLSRGARRWIALSSALLAGGVSATVAPGLSGWFLVVTIVANALGAAILVGAAATLSRLTLCDEVAAVTVLSRRLEAVTDDLQSDQAQLHEIRGTLAGIATATDLLRRSGISPDRRSQLEAMVNSELQRLQRLVSARSGGRPTPVELDQALRPVVVRYRTEGLPVHWQPSNHVAMARADDVAEIVNVLLSNARRHAGRRPVHIDVATVGDRVRITVRDRGPGVGNDVRSRLFQWGARRSGSPGEGVGLATARMLADEIGGSLNLGPTVGPGATFVLELVAADQPTRKEAEQ